MTWTTKELGTARRTSQDRFRIHLEILDYFSPEHLNLLALQDDDDDQYLCYKDGFAKELLACLGDHLSISDLRQIVDVFGVELIRREHNRLSGVSCD